MKNQKWLLLLMVLALIAATVGALSWLRTHQRLGQPGVQATAIPGSVMMKIDLPERALDFTSTNVPEPQVVLDYLPGDTSYAERHYLAPDGFDAYATLILMGADRTSIHRPEYCLLGQGWKTDEKTRVLIPLDTKEPRVLPVMKWVMSKEVQMPDGGKQVVRGFFVFWFVADNEQTTGNVQFQCYLIRDLLFKGVLQRWAYVSYFSHCAPGQEDAAFERMKKLIAASAPDFLLPPGKR